MKFIKTNERLPERNGNYFVKRWNWDRKSTYNSTAAFEVDKQKFFDHYTDSFGEKVEATVESWLDEKEKDLEE